MKTLDAYEIEYFAAQMNWKEGQLENILNNGSNFEGIWLGFSDDGHLKVGAVSNQASTVNTRGQMFWTTSKAMTTLEQRHERFIHIHNKLSSKYYQD